MTIEQKCYPLIRGEMMRATRLDRCGRVETGPCVSVVTDGFVEISLTSRTTEGTVIEQVKANGKKCYSNKGTPTWDGWTVNVQFCGVDPLIFNMMTNQQVIYDADGMPIGFELSDDVDLEGVGVALETWMLVPADACDPDDPNAQGSWGYSILPFLKGGVLGDRTVNNGSVDFTIQNMETTAGSGWGTGPYDVMLGEDGNPGPLLTPIGARAHERLFFTSVAPPTPGCSCEASGPPATGATAGTPATWTPADSYPPETFAALTTAAPVASPATPWTVGQYAVLGDGTEVHWDGDSWELGRAPA